MVLGDVVDFLVDSLCGDEKIGVLFVMSANRVKSFGLRVKNFELRRLIDLRVVTSIEDEDD